MEKAAIDKPKIDWKRLALSLETTVPWLCFAYDISARFHSALDRYVRDPGFSGVTLEDLKAVLEEELRKYCGDDFCGVP